MPTHSTDMIVLGTLQWLQALYLLTELFWASWYHRAMGATCLPPAVSVNIYINLAAPEVNKKILDAAPGSRTSACDACFIG